jgi:hypothetical protein
MQKWTSIALAMAVFVGASAGHAQSLNSNPSLFAPSYASTAAALAESSSASPRRLLAEVRDTPARAARPRRNSAVLAQSSDAQGRARARFEDGRRFAGQLEWAQAAQAFEESYQLFPRPNTLFNLGLAHRALGQYLKAIEELERFLQEATPTPAERAEVSEALDSMRGRLAHLIVAPSVENARITVDGNAAEPNTDVTLDPGNHVVEVTAQGYVRNAQTITLRQSESRRLDVRMERAGGISVGAVVGIVAGVVAAGVTAVVLGVVLSREEDPYCGTLNYCIMPQ